MTTWLKTLVLLAVSGGLFFLLNTKFGQLPPLGNFFSPFTGFWQNNRTLDTLPETLDFPELTQSVQVVWDERHVPHIFAQNLHDLYFAQGYLTARHRLWQMEFQTHAAAGRLSEIVGAQAIEFDRFRRRIGMTIAAERSEKKMLANSETALVAMAYSDGVNAWIERLNDATLPVEYKLLDYKPERWSPQKTALFLSYFAYTLTFRNNDAEMTRTRAALGDDLFQKLYPILPPLTEPIVQSDSIVNRQTITLPKKRAQILSLGKIGKTEDDEPYIFGSNNWAVSGNLTSSGKPMLCNDPHLALNLPSIWYETQLVCEPEKLNVYGVSAPGVPSVLIGFNEQIAWGVTNGTSDAIDWFDVEFTDSTHRAYRYNGGTRNTSMRLEEIKVRGAASIMDTIVQTHIGNVVYRQNETPFDESVPKNAAIDWAVHRTENELLTFLKLARAKNYDDYVSALSTYNCPAQNFVFACNDGDIAIWHNGLFPKRKKYQGAFVLNGRDSLDEQREMIPRNELPHLKNPARGFVSSANQHAVDDAYSYYLGWDYAAFERSSRINARISELASTKKITADDMKSLQTDALNPLAKLILPTMLKTLDKSSLSGDAQKSVEELKHWNYENLPQLIAPTIFERWWSLFQKEFWKDIIPVSAPYPNRSVTASIVVNNKTDSLNSSFVSREKLATTLNTTFSTAVDTLQARYGAFGDAWAWKHTRKTTVQHLARLSPFSREQLETSGNYNAVNATSATSGPSWRMVVELGDTVKAWGIYPGGQSGDAGSRFYDQMIDDWVKGNYYSLLFLKSPNDNASTVGKTEMRRAENPPSAISTALNKIGNTVRLSWYIYIIIVPFLVGLFATVQVKTDLKWQDGFLVNAISIGALYLLGMLVFIGFYDAGIIGSKVAALVKIRNPYLLALIASLVMSVVAGVFGVTGYVVGRLFVRQEKLTT